MKRHRANFRGTFATAVTEGAQFAPRPSPVIRSKKSRSSERDFLSKPTGLVYHSHSLENTCISSRFSVYNRRLDNQEHSRRGVRSSERMSPIALRALHTLQQAPVPKACTFVARKEYIALCANEKAQAPCG